MKFRLFLLAFLLSPVAMAEELWNYSANVLTQIDGGWVFNVTDAGVLTCKTVGTATTVDLRTATLPAGTPTIVKVGDMRSKGVCTHFYVPETVTELVAYAFYAWSALEYIRLPDTLETIGSCAIRDCPKLVCIEPCLPHTVRGTVSDTVRGCPLLTNVFEIGFATDASGNPLTTTLGMYNIYGNKAMPGMRFGPAITSIPQQWGNGAACKFLDFGENVTSIAAFGEAFRNSLTNVVLRRTADFTPSAGLFKYGTLMHTVVWNGWCEYEPNGRGNNPFWCCKGKWCRFIVPGDNLKWRAYMADPSKVTPWSAVSASDKTAYFTRYGADATTPVGISKKVYYGLPATYICTNGAAQAGCVLGMPTIDPQFGTLTLDPAPNANGTYDAGTQVKVTFTPASGVTFYGWKDAPEMGSEATCYVTLTSDTAIAPLYAADTWRYDATGLFLYDGAWKVLVSSTSGGELTVTSVKVTSPLPIDLRKPIEGDRRIVALGLQAFSENNDHDDCGELLPNELTGIYLPDTLKSVGKQAFDSCYKLAFCSPCVPDSVESFGERVFQHTRVLTNALHIGYATNSLTHEPIFTELYQYIFWDAQGMTGADFGPGITNYNANLWLNGNNFKWVSFGPNMNAKYGTTFAGEQLCGTASGTLTNIVFKSTEDISFVKANRLFHNCKKIREITWNGWFDYEASTTRNPFSYWDALQCRFIVPGDNAKWIAYCADGTKVLPWADCSASDKSTYFTRYGADAKEPVGISIAVNNGLPRTYIVKSEAEIAGHVLGVASVDARFAGVAVSPAIPASGLYPEGETVTVTLTLSNGVSFCGWEGNVDTVDRMNTTLTLTMDQDRALTATFVADYYLMQDGKLSDGYCTFTVAADTTSPGIAGAFKVIDIFAAQGDTIDFRKPIVGDGVLTRICDGFIRQGDGIHHVYLPNTVNYIESYAFGDWNGNSEIESISPCYPTNVAVYCERSLQYLSSMTNGLEVGFATDASGSPIETVLPQGPWGCKKLSYVKFGPGVYSVPIFCHSECGSIGCVEFGVNVTNILEHYSFCSSTLTNIIFRQTNDFTLAKSGWNDGVFRSCSSVREVTWSGWFEYTATATDNPFYGWGNLQCRFIYPGDNLKWVAYVGDPSKVVPWAECSNADKETYFARYGSEATVPVGISIAVANGLPRTYLVSDGKTLPGFSLVVNSPSTNFFRVSLSPAIPESGYYEVGEEVTVSIVDKDPGVTFVRWTGNVPEGEETNLSFVVVMDGVKSVEPIFCANFWVYEDGKLTDGDYTFNASGANEAITIGSFVKLENSKVLDLAKPVKGGVVVALGKSVFDCDSNTPKVISLPETLRAIGARTMCWSGQTSVSPLVPQGVTNIAHDAFLWAFDLMGSVSVGFATNAVGEPLATKVDYGAFARATHLGPDIRVGPGIRKLADNVFANVGLWYPGRLDFHFSAALTNISDTAFIEDGFQPDDYAKRCISYHFEGDIPVMKTNAFVTTACQLRPYVRRFFVPRSKECPKWLALADDASKVIPWAALPSETREAYWTKFPKGTYGANRPTGLTTSAACAAGVPANQWLFIERCSGTFLFVR